jgi:hypothetical protein
MISSWGSVSVYFVDCRLSPPKRYLANAEVVEELRIRYGFDMRQGMAFWGEKYRWFFLNLCLRSLLSPRNIPALVNKRASRFVVFAPRVDLDAIEKTPIVSLLRQHIELQAIEIVPLEELWQRFGASGLRVLVRRIAARLAAPARRFALRRARI